jgi:hypothetical protein
MAAEQLREYALAILCMAALVFVAFFAAYAGSSSWESQEAQRDIEPSAHERIVAEHESASSPSLIEKKEGGERANHTEEKGTEFLPLIFGFRLKITDALSISFSAGLFTATIILSWATWGLWKTTAKSIALSRDEFISSQRPKLRVRNVVFTGQSFNEGFGRPRMPSGQFYVVNVGGTRAHIIDSLTMTSWCPTRLPMRRPYEGMDGNGAVPIQTLEPGEPGVGIFGSDFTLTRGQWQEMGRPIGAGNLCVLGWVDYKDDRGFRRRTAFCREFRSVELDAPGEGRFVPVDDPDYEYEE